jgi:hypothetical protein
MNVLRRPLPTKDGHPRMLDGHPLLTVGLVRQHSEGPTLSDTDGYVARCGAPVDTFSSMLLVHVPTASRRESIAIEPDHEVMAMAWKVRSSQRTARGRKL